MLALRLLTDDDWPASPPADLVSALRGADTPVIEQARPIDLPNALRALPEGIVVFGVDGLVWAANDAARRILGFEPAYGGSAAGVLDQIRHFGGEQLSEDRFPFSAALAGETVTEVELYVRPRAPEGSPAETVETVAPIIASVAPLSGARGVAGVILTMRSVSRIRRQDRLLEEFVTSVVHESRGALSAILGCVSLVESLAQEPIRPRRTPGFIDPETRFLGMIRSDAWQISSMLNELIDVARIGAHDLRLDLQPVDVVALVEDILEHIAPNDGTLATGHRVSLRPRRLIPVVEADSARIEQVLTSLVMTIARYSPPGTDIAVDFETGTDAVVVAVSAGEGEIAPAELTRLFEQYLSRREMKADRKTLGPSLFVSRGLVEAHGGKIWAESRIGHGTTFRFSLPLR
jgi:signal transduction histidine kinase